MTKINQEELKQKAKQAVEHASRTIEHKINSNVLKIASKDMKCDASAWLKINLTEELFNQMTSEEQESVLKAKRNQFLIKKGEAYIRQFGVYDGKKYVSKFNKQINEICAKYNLYQK